MKSGYMKSAKCRLYVAIQMCANCVHDAQFHNMFSEFTFYSLG